MKLFKDIRLIVFTTAFLVSIVCYSTLKKIFKQQTQNVIESFLRRDSVPNSRIAIFTSLQTEADKSKYKEALMTWQCYAETYGYFFRIFTVNDSVEYDCNQETVHFWRHCLVGKFLEKHQDSLDYALMFDADMGVINPRHRIQEWIEDPPDPKVEMQFYVRHFSIEIASGSYIVKNTVFARHFLTYFGNCNYRQPDPQNSLDNGMLHQVFMELSFKAPARKFACFNLLKNHKNVDPEYFSYLACTWLHLGYQNSRFMDGKILIHHKLNGKPSWVRDMWLTEHKVGNRDFIFHPLKSAWRDGHWKWIFKRQTFDDSLCIDDGKFQNWEYLDGYFVSDEEIFDYLKNNSQMVEKNNSAIMATWQMLGKQ